MREGGDRTMVCAERLQGIVSRELTLVITAIPEDMSEGNASGDVTNKQARNQDCTINNYVPR